MSSEQRWSVRHCAAPCMAGHRGMDRCAACDGVGSQLVYDAVEERYPNTEDGWNKMKAKHPEVEDTPDAK